jgi:hypothetical protein
MLTAALLVTGLVDPGAPAAAAAPARPSTAVRTAATAATVPLPPSMVDLTISTPTISAGEKASLTATVDQPVQATGASLTIWDTTTNTAVGSCTSGTTCVKTVTFSTGGPHTYEARVSGLTSAPVILSRALWSVSLTADRTEFAAGEKVALTATPNQDITKASPYRLYIWDVTTGAMLQTCQYGSAAWVNGACQVTASHMNGTPHVYRAYVAQGPTYMGSAITSMTDIQATSNDVSAERAAWSISLVTDRTVFAAGERVTLTATPNQDPRKTGSSYAVYFVDVTTGLVLDACDVYGGDPQYGVDNACSTTTTFVNGGAHTYRAYVAKRDPNAARTGASLLLLTDVQARSNEVSAQRAPWTISLTAQRVVTSTGTKVQLTARPDQDPRKTGGKYAVYFRNESTGRVVASCGIWGGDPDHQADNSCSTSLPILAGPAHAYRAYVATRDGQVSHPYVTTQAAMTDIQAVSGAVILGASNGPTLPGETSGGSNPSGACSQRCHGDPVNSVTGEFWESISDLAVPGAGPGLVWSRSFAATRAATDGPMGFGWTGAYGMRLAPQGGAPLASAPWVQGVCCTDR